VVGVLEAARTAAADALAETPELLPVLKQAGVVDAGGQGYCLLLDAALHVVDGRPVPRLDQSASGDPVATAVRATGDDAVQLVDHGHGAPTAGLAALRYEVMYLLEAPDAAIAAFKDVWAGIGDSIVVVGGDGLWNCHIHTDDIGAAIEAAIDIGRPRQIRVTDLLEEVDEERWVREAAAAGQQVEEPPHVHEPVRTAVVAVATGEGIRRLFLSLGVQRIVTGGQSMNPSTAQLLEAVDSAPADEVVLLPNNKNIVPVAEQVAPLTTKQVRVLPTKGITEGLAAAMQYDPEGAVDDNLAAMARAAQAVVSGEITRAVRSSVCEAGPIAEGDHLGIVRDGIAVVAPALTDALTGLLAKIVTDDHEIVTLIEGEGSSPADTRRVGEWLADHRPGVSLEVHHGGQPLYPYLVGVE
jgi:DAK2 domain fusion protein YloV